MRQRDETVKERRGNLKKMSQKNKLKMIKKQ